MAKHLEGHYDHNLGHCCEHFWIIEDKKVIESQYVDPDHTYGLDLNYKSKSDLLKIIIKKTYSEDNEPWQREKETDREKEK